MEQCTYDITIDQGADFYWPIEVVDEVDGVEVPVDLTGYSAEMQIRETYGDTVILATYSTANGKITLDELFGMIYIKEPYTETDDYPSDFKGVYDIKLTSPAPITVDRLIQGKAIVNPEVTR